MRNDNLQPRIRTMRTGLAFGAVALIALPLQAAPCACGDATGDPPASGDPPAALPLEPATEQDVLGKELARVLLSDDVERMPGRLSRFLNPFCSGGGLFGTSSDSVVFNAAAGGSPERAIRAVWSQVDAAWNARDAQSFSRRFAEDVSFRFVRRGQSLDGRATILEHFRERFPRYAPDLRHRTRIGAVRAVAPGVFTADGEVRILRQAVGAEESPVILRTFDIFAVMSGNDEAWSIRALRIYELPATTRDAD